MLKNQLLSALRPLRKNRNFSPLNTFGLSLGMACSILIFLWIQDETSFDRFHERRASIFQVKENQHYEGKTYTFSSVPGLLALSLKSEMPEVKYAVRTDWGQRWLFEREAGNVFENGLEVDPDFMKLFTFPVIAGNTATPLADPSSIVISERMAKKLFGETNAIGKTLRTNNRQFTVSAVVKDVPSTSTIQFDWLVSFANFEKDNPWITDWGSNALRMYVELHPTADAKAVNRKLYGFIQEKYPSTTAYPFLFAMDDWHLRNKFEEGVQAGGREEYVKLFGIIALLVIIVACINFMNLATARSEQRAKEVGVRKTLGASRGMLMAQFIGESVLLSFIALGVACGIVYAVLPLFNTLVEKELSLRFNNPVEWLVLTGIALVCGMLAGSYPSFYLSSFSPLSVFRGFRTGKHSRALFIRKGLVVTQFVVSIALIISVVVIYRQVEHVKNRPFGYQLDNVIHSRLTDNEREHFSALRDDLLATGAVTNAAATNQDMFDIENSSGDFTWAGKDPSKLVLVSISRVSPGYFDVAGMQLKTGRDFGPVAAHDSNSVIINETLAKLLGPGDPIGKMIRRDGKKQKYDLFVVGVVKDFVFNDMYKAPDPVVFLCEMEFTDRLCIRLKGGDGMEAQLDKVKTVLAKHDPGYPFEYNFYDEDFGALFRGETLIGELSRLFAALAILISCIGLFGLAAYTAERRTKEIGIRKVLGASVPNVIALLTKDFLLLVGIAIVIASPLAWYFMHAWLQDFAYRIDISAWMFLLAGAGAMGIAVITVSFQAIRAAIANPVKSLRTE